MEEGGGSICSSKFRCFRLSANLIHNIWIFVWRGKNGTFVFCFWGKPCPLVSYSKILSAQRYKDRTIQQFKSIMVKKITFFRSNILVETIVNCYFMQTNQISSLKSRFLLIKNLGMRKCWINYHLWSLYLCFGFQFIW